MFIHYAEFCSYCNESLYWNCIKHSKVNKNLEMLDKCSVNISKVHINFLVNLIGMN